MSTQSDIKQDVNAPTIDQDIEEMEIRPLGGGCEVGRSCHILKFKNKTIMLDCGILPSVQGISSLPLVQEIDPASIDIIFITHFHLDHSAALPRFTERMKGFRGRIFATGPTIAVMRFVLQDFVRVRAISEDSNEGLYDQEELDRCLARMEPVGLHQRMSVNGVDFTFLNAGHVLGACMVMIEIDGIRTLYTGDYSCEEDRHLPAAEVPVNSPPHVLIVEATHGVMVHESRQEREHRFLSAVEAIVRRGGRCLIPVFALGRAQELLLILEEFWGANPDLQHIPVFYASKMAERSLGVYRDSLSFMNQRMQHYSSSVGNSHGANPFDFKHIRKISEADFEDSGPCVVLASPGMLQSGFSRQLFDRWCSDARNGVVLAGYSVEGSLARELESGPRLVESLTHRRLVRLCSIDRVSFSAHADAAQTRGFVDALRPGAIVLVHGERTEMRRLQGSLLRSAADLRGFQGVFSPENNRSLLLPLQKERVVRIVGRLARKRLIEGTILKGLMVVDPSFEAIIVDPADLQRFSVLATHRVLQKVHVPYRGSLPLLSAFVKAMYGGVGGVQEVDTPDSILGLLGVAASSSTSLAASTDGGDRKRSKTKKEEGDSRSIQHKMPQYKSLSVADGAVTLTYVPPDRVILSWSASPVADAIADSLVSVILHAELSQATVMATATSCTHKHREDDSCSHLHHHQTAPGLCGSDALVVQRDTDTEGLEDDEQNALSSTFCTHGPSKLISEAGLTPAKTDLFDSSSTHFSSSREIVLESKRLAEEKVKEVEDNDRLMEVEQVALDASGASAGTANIVSLGSNAAMGASQAKNLFAPNVFNGNPSSVSVSDMKQLTVDEKALVSYISNPKQLRFAAESFLPECWAQIILSSDNSPFQGQHKEVNVNVITTSESSVAALSSDSHTAAHITVELADDNTVKSELDDPDRLSSRKDISALPGKSEKGLSKLKAKIAAKNSIVPDVSVAVPLMNAAVNPSSTPGFVSSSTFRRRETLMRILRDQYGESVNYLGFCGRVVELNDGKRSFEAINDTFCVFINLDFVNKSALIVFDMEHSLPEGVALNSFLSCHPKKSSLKADDCTVRDINNGFTIVSNEGMGSKITLGGALERIVALVDGQFKNL